MYLNKLTDVASPSAGGTCDSSTDSSNHNCLGATDGTMDVAWATDTLTNVEWWSVTFPSEMKVVRIDMRSLCRNNNQGDRWTLTFSDGSTLQV